MSTTPSNQDLYDEAAMQDAIAVAKQIGTLKERNPQDAPKPVQDKIDYKPKSKPVEKQDLQKTSEDKAFEELEQRHGGAKWSAGGNRLTVTEKVWSPGGQVIGEKQVAINESGKTKLTENFSKPAIGEGKFTGNQRTNGSRQQGSEWER